MSDTSEVPATAGTPGVSGPTPPAAGPAPATHRRSEAGRGLFEAVITGNTVVVTALAIVLALVIGGLLIAVSDPTVGPKWGYFFSEPSDALSGSWHSITSAYTAMFHGAIYDPSGKLFGPISETIVFGTPLIFAGLSVSLAFRAGLFNIGGEGQVVVGALFAGLVGFKLHLPPVLHITVAVAAGFAGGALWGGIAGWLKARTGAHEVISTIMLNYIALNLLFYLLSTKELQRPGRSDPISPMVDASARLPHLAGPGLRVHAGFLIALAAAGAMAWLLNRSTTGFEFRAVGANADAARTAGISVGRSYVLVMLLAGGLAGLAGANQVLGTQLYLSPFISASLGFDAITVALLGRATPWGTVLAGLLVGGLRAGGVHMQAATATPIDVVIVIQAVMVLFIAAPPLVRAVFRLREARSGGGGQMLAKGW